MTPPRDNSELEVSVALAGAARARTGGAAPGRSGPRRSCRTNAGSAGRQVRRRARSPHYEHAWRASEPLVTVRIATYNNAELLCERTLASLRAQTYERWEAIVVGDALTDDTAERIAALGDPRIRFVNLPVPRALPGRRRPALAGRGHLPGQPREPAGRAAPGSRRWTTTTSSSPTTSRCCWHAPERPTRSSRTGACGCATARPPARHDRGRRLAARYSQFGFQGAIYHAGLREFGYDVNAYLPGEPGDWNLARRMWEAGVRFAFLDRIVTTYYWVPHDEQGRAWLAEVRAAAARESRARPPPARPTAARARRPRSAPGRRAARGSAASTSPRSSISTALPASR